jgi:hypothetical protein
VLVLHGRHEGEVIVKTLIKLFVKSWKFILHMISHTNYVVVVKLCRLLSCEQGDTECIKRIA